MLPGCTAWAAASGWRTTSEGTGPSVCLEIGLKEGCLSNVVISTHPLVRHKLAALRDVRTAPADFRRAVRSLAVLLAYEAMADLPARDTEVATPLGGPGAES